MALEDYLEPEVGIAVAVTAAVASPKVRGALRRGAVYGLAGLLKVGDAMSSAARSVQRGVQTSVAEAQQSAAETPPADGVATVTTDGAEPEPHPRRTRKATEAAPNE